MNQLDIVRELEILRERMDYMASLNNVNKHDKVASGARYAYKSCSNALSRLQARVIAKGIEQEVLDEV